MLYLLLLCCVKCWAIQITKKKTQANYYTELKFLVIMFQNVNKKMPSTSRPRVSGGSGNIGRIGTPNAPMSERQQMALLMQMTSPTNSPGNFTIPRLIQAIDAITQTENISPDSLQYWLLNF